MIHSRGPWKAVQPKHDPQAWDVCTENGGVLAKLVWGGEGGANARLMAAAPDLLHALDCILWRHAEDEYIPTEFWDMAKEAVAKAKGDQSSATNGITK